MASAKVCPVTVTPPNETRNEKERVIPVRGILEEKRYLLCRICHVVPLIKVPVSVERNPDKLPEP